MNKLISLIRIFLLLFLMPIIITSCADQNPVPQTVTLKDGEECKETLCACGNVKIDKGCKCRLTGPTGIGVDCPPKPVNIGLIGGGLVLLILTGLVILVIRRRTSDSQT